MSIHHMTTAPQVSYTSERAGDFSHRIVSNEKSRQQHCHSKSVGARSGHRTRSVCHYRHVK